MWSPTHVQVTVKRAAGLITKGNNGTNDCFVIIALGKEKYQTSIKQKSEPNVEWNEECELLIPSQGNTAEIILTVLHRNFLGVDEFLGTVRIPLAEFDVYERPRNRWYKLQSKPLKEKKEKKERGELEVRISFLVKAGSLTDLSKKDKHKSSLGQLTHMAQSVGGSLLSIGTLEKRKGLKKFAKSLGNKVKINSKKKGNTSDDDSIPGSVNSLGNQLSFKTFNGKPSGTRQTAEDADPGVISEDEDEFALDDLSHKSSNSSLAYSTTSTIAVSTSPAPGKPPRSSLSSYTNVTDSQPVDEWEQKLYGKSGKGITSSAGSLESLKNNGLGRVPSSPVEGNVGFDKTVTLKEVVEEPVEEKAKEKEKENKFGKKLKYFRKDKFGDSDMKTEMASFKHFDERIIIGGEKEISHSDSITNKSRSVLSSDVLKEFEGKSREDIVALVLMLRGNLDEQKRRMRDLEDYLDELLLRVMETTPRILQNPYETCRFQAHTKY